MLTRPRRLQYYHSQDENSSCSEQSLERSIALDANDPSPYFELAAVLRIMGDTAGGRAMLAKFQAVNSAQGKK